MSSKETPSSSVARAEWWLDQAWDEGAINGVDVPRAARALAQLLDAVRRETIGECIRAADAGREECRTGCHQRLQALLSEGDPR